mmetsp:Transcript_13723/g.51176  ORF Transcript_13723/g.51176 Transcript_13723/m.51176 type:complete len:218 (-) Transcript_13723:151-804(-)
MTAARLALTSSTVSSPPSRPSTSMLAKSFWPMPSILSFCAPAFCRSSLTLFSKSVTGTKASTREAVVMFTRALLLKLRCSARRDACTTPVHLSMSLLRPSYAIFRAARSSCTLAALGTTALAEAGGALSDDSPRRAATLRPPALAVIPAASSRSSPSWDTKCCAFRAFASFSFARVPRPSTAARRARWFTVVLSSFSCSSSSSFASSASSSSSSSSS